MRRGRREAEVRKKCREVVASMDLMKREFACALRFAS